MEVDMDDLIDDYLKGRMAPADRERFERRLAAEPGLAARVALERDVAAALDNTSPENQLRATLQQLSTRYAAPENLVADPVHTATRRRLWILAAGLLIFGAVGIWALSRKKKPAEIQPAPPSLESPALPSGQKSPPAQTTDKPGTAKKSKPIAAAFQPLPELESYVGSQIRSGTTRIFVHEPQSNTVLPLRAGQVLFQLSGKTEGNRSAGAGLRLLIFSNKRQDFEAMQPVASQTLAPDPEGTFFVKKQLAPTSGLFYFVIEDQESGEWLFVDKFLVKI